MSDINSVIVVGRVVEKPTLGNSDTPVINIRIANNVYQGKGKEEKVNWLTVTAFGNTAINCEKYLDKGSQVCILGRLDYSQWEKDGQKKSMVKIIANQVQFIGGKQESNF
jgi:single-strand DNA-binding protein